MFQLSAFLRLATLAVFFFSVCTSPDGLTWYPVTSSATPTFTISFVINLGGLSEGSSSALLLQAYLIFCLSIVIGSGSVWLWSSLRPESSSLPDLSCSDSGARLFNTSPQFGMFEHFILSEFISINDKSWVPPISYKVLDASHVTKWTNLPGDLNGERICMWIKIMYVPCVLNYLIIEHVFIIYVYILKAVYKCSSNEF